MSKAILAALAALALGGGIAHADPEKNDIFWTVVHEVYGINITRTDALNQGAAVCAWLETTHKPFAMAGLQLMEMHPDWSLEDAGHFAGAATSAWCPEVGPSSN